MRLNALTESLVQLKAHDTKRATHIVTTKTAADYYVSDLPGLPDDARQLSLYAGHVPCATDLSTLTSSSATSDAHLWFLLVRSRHIAKAERLVIWLNGGPGCSGLEGGMLELGPLRVNDDDQRTLRVAPHAWSEYANVLFLDQPAGTGFSFVSRQYQNQVTELGPAADQVATFLRNFYTVFPEFEAMDTFLTGESFAGQWLPYIADAILRTNTLATKLKGVLIGNGWISPRHQYPAYLSYVVERGLVTEGSRAFDRVARANATCARRLGQLLNTDPDGRGTVLVPECEAILSAIGAATAKDGKCLNMYNTTQYEPCGAQWPSGLQSLTPYLRRDDVVRALHADALLPAHWDHCSATVGANFWVKGSTPAYALLPRLLENDVPVLLFAGDADLMCSYNGIERLIAELDWAGARGFNGSTARDWSVNGSLVGEWTMRDRLTYVRFRGASHMVPIDRPAAAHDMLIRFLGIDTMSAAGRHARVPSRLGNESERIVGATHPNGTSIDSALVVGSDDDSSSNNNNNGAAEKGSDDTSSVVHGGYDKDHEEKFGPRQTAVLVITLLAIGTAVYAFLHWVARRRRRKYRAMKGKARAIHLDDDEAYVPLRQPLPQSRRSVHFQQQDAEDDDERESDDSYEAARRDQHIFDVGGDDDDDDDTGTEEEDDDELAGDMGATKHNPWKD